MPRSRKDSLTAGFALLLTACFFVWPVVAGIPVGNSRFLWVVIATACALASVTALRRSVSDAPHAAVMGSVPWVPLLAVPLVVLLLGTGFPVISFGDEMVIAAGGRTVAHALLQWLTPAGAAAVCIVLLAAAIGIVRSGSYRTMLVVLLLAAAASGVAAVWLPTSGVALRYPPVVHLVQVLGTLLTGGAPLLFRAPNALWTLLLVWIVWRMTPGWNATARWITLAGIMLGPLGWPYRILLYQACGELTFGAACAFVVAGVLQHPRDRWRGGVLGGLCALWILYRPTALLAYAALIAVLVLRRRWRAVADVSLVTLPVAAAWFALAPLYTAQYGMVTDDGQLLPFAAGSVLQPFSVALKALPENLHPAGLAAFVLSVAAALLFGARDDRWTLLAACAMAVATGAAQNFVTDPIVYGVARYSILLLIAQGIALGILARSSDPRPRFVAAIATVILVAVTPWLLVPFLQQQRLPGKDIYRTPTEGYLVSPLPDVVAESLALGQSPIIIAPDYQFLELPTTSGVLTPQQRAELAEAGMTWTVHDPRRPVIIQAPVSTTYRPNLSEEQESRLREAREWGLRQPDARVVRLGIEETVIVP